jgi:hypothetical protein
VTVATVAPVDRLPDAQAAAAAGGAATAQGDGAPPERGRVDDPNTTSPSKARATDTHQ